MEGSWLAGPVGSLASKVYSTTKFSITEKRVSIMATSTGGPTTVFSLLIQGHQDAHAEVGTGVVVTDRRDRSCTEGHPGSQ